jgi:hypothetical protein
MSERLFRVFIHGIEAFQTHLSPGDEVIANGTDIGIVGAGEKSPFQTTAATAEADQRGLLTGKDAGQIKLVDKRGAASAPKAKPAAKKKATAPKRKPAAKAPAKKKSAARKRSSAKK